MKTNKLTKTEWIFLAACFVFFFLWAVKQPYTYAPDEEMRFQIPQYIYEHGILPNGWDESIRSSQWGFSYAFYPCFLGPLVSALFMAVTGIFTKEFFALLVAARMTSVVSGTLTVYFAMKISKVWLKKPYRWLLPALLALLPQFAFLSSYVNNDIVAILGSSVIIYAWSLGLKEWTVKNCGLLAAGVIIVALSYYNAYGWILGSIILFIMSFAFKTGSNQGGMKQMWKMAGFVSAIVLVFIFFFFIRNAIIYQGDFLGMSSLTEASEMYALDFLKPSNRSTPKNLGMTVGEMMTSLEYTGRTWPRMTYESFVGVLGCMTVFIGSKIYGLYACIFSAGGLGFLGALLTGRGNGKERILQHIFHGMMALGFCIPVLLSIYYSYSTDYQAQGRYCATMIVALMYFVAKGLSWFLELLERFIGEKTAKTLAVLFCLGLAAVAAKVFLFTYLPSIS